MASPAGNLSTSRDADGFMKKGVALGDTERYREATLAELYYLSKQHDDKKPWHDKSVPLRARRPRIVVPLYRKMVETLDRWLWSGNRAPSLKVETTAGVDDNVGPVLSEQDAEDVTDFLVRLVRVGGLLRAAREATNKAIITTSAAVVVTVRNGRLGYYVRGGKDCAPTFEDYDPLRVTTLDIRYKFPKEEQVSPMSSTTRTVWYWYRRYLDAERDVTYAEQLVRSDGREPEWVEDPARTVEHGFGFCPVVWFRTLPDCDDLVDGKPVIDPALYPLLDAVSYTVSQKQRAVEYGTDPQPWRKGVTEDQRTDLEKAPGTTWDLPGDTSEGGKVEVGFLEASGTGAERAGEHIHELEQVLREVVGIVDAGPEMAARAVTGIALEMLYQPMTTLCSDLRYDMGDVGYVGILDTALRVVAAVQKRGGELWVPGATKIESILTKAQKAGPWLPLPITLGWPGFFGDTEQDKLQRVQSVVAALTAKVITRETAVRALARTFDVENPEAEVEALEKDDAEAEKADAEQSQQSHERMLELKSTPKVATKVAPLEKKEPTDAAQ